MTKYTSNEQYEKDKVEFIADIERFAGIQKMLHETCEHHEAEELVNLLKQSEWVGAKSQMLAEIYCLADDIAQDLDCNIEYCSPRVNEAIGEAIPKADKIMELIDNG